ncbi:MAG: SprT-like domain-containing protein [Lachnospiraceae bacterium]|nr:SprT-like domain-containing protein [Lachnospiraceae bacterium]MBR1857776.1 SprT-like domain-containing protein [Oribacterium sp.]
MIEEQLESVHGKTKEVDDCSSLRPIISKLENVFSIFNDHFFSGELEHAVITVASDSKGRCYGWCTAYRAWHKGEDLDLTRISTMELGEVEEQYKKGFYEINLVAEYLRRPFAEIAETLLHEMVHLYCLQHDIKDTSRSGTYHNANFRDAAIAHGLVVSKDNRYGFCITKLNDEAKKYVLSLDVQDFGMSRTFPIIFGETGGTVAMAEPKQRVRKYVCPSCGNSVRATKAVNIACIDCDCRMKLEERKKIS